MTTSFPVAIFKATKFLLTQKSPSQELNSVLIWHYQEKCGLLVMSKERMSWLVWNTTVFPASHVCQAAIYHHKTKNRCYKTPARLWPQINNQITHPLNTYIQNTMQTIKILGPHPKKKKYNSIENLMYTKAYF